MSRVLYLTEEDVRRHLKLDPLIDAMERALSDLSKTDNGIIQPARLIMPIPVTKGAYLAMPCGVGGEALGCKIVTAFSNNSQLGLPSVMANILLHDPNTGQLKIILEGNTLTGLRTAAASVVATKELHSGEKCRLAILGAGIQAKAHAIALNHAFKFKEVSIWNRHNEKAKKLVEELRSECLTDGTDFQVSSTAEQCVRDADVICTTTYASEPILHFEWIKPGVHINAVGAGVNHHSELDTRTYQNSVVVTDSMASASEELKGLANIGVPVYAEIGQIINKTVKIPKTHCTIFHSLGMALEDILAARVVIKSYIKEEEVKNSDIYAQINTLL